LARWFGSVSFVGCDLAADTGQTWLVTNWILPSAATGLDVSLRLLAPSGSATLIRQALAGPVVTTSLPPAFFAGGEAGQVWLAVIDRQSGQTVAPTTTLIAPDRDGWLRVCR
jgi:hypothetical protein